MSEKEQEADGLNLDVLSGLVLLVAAILALVVANSPLSEIYDKTLHHYVSIGIEPAALNQSVLHWINDGLMVVFFFVVGLEIKREILVGALSNRQSAMLPAIAALGGMVVPALIYASINWDNAEALRGWAIPAATDIAFAVGVIALLGKRVPIALRIFLLALAIIDDLGAIIIIALFYTSELSTTALALAAVGIAALVTLNRANVVSVTPYLVVGLLTWLCVLQSGVHATLAGVITALAVPLAGANAETEGPLEKLEHALSPWVKFAILPIFAFANAGVSLAGITPAELLMPIPLGIALGLFLGKAIGIYGASRLAIAAGLGEMPNGATQIQLFGTAVLGGIGFTMSLFIGMLAFPNAAVAADLRLGVLTGSIISATVGYVILRNSSRRGPLHSSHPRNRPKSVTEV